MYSASAGALGLDGASKPRGVGWRDAACCSPPGGFYSGGEVNFTVCKEKEQDHENVRTMKRVGMCKNRCWSGLAFGIGRPVGSSGQHPCREYYLDYFYRCPGFDLDEAEMWM